MTPTEKVRKILSKMEGDVIPQLGDWTERAEEIWKEAMEEYRSQLIGIHEEIKETLAQDHLQIFGAIIAVTHPQASLTAMLLEYEMAGVKLLADMNDFIGDKQENDQSRMRTINSVLGTSEPDAVGRGPETEEPVLDAGSGDNLFSDRGSEIPLY